MLRFRFQRTLHVPIHALQEVSFRCLQAFFDNFIVFQKKHLYLTPIILSRIDFINSKSVKDKICVQLANEVLGCLFDYHCSAEKTAAA